MFEKRYTLLRTQKRRVYEILRQAGLEPAEFSWSREEIAGSLIVSKLSHRGGERYFLFSSYEMNSWCVACPGLFRSMDYHYPKSWEEQERIFRRWAECLKREVDSPDPWAEMAKYRLIPDGEPAAEIVNEPIPAIEAEQIGRALLRLGDSVTHELTLNMEQSLLVRARFETLAEATRRQRSRDWMYMVLGVCTTVAMSLSLTQERTAILWGAVRSELGAFVRLLPARAAVERQSGRIRGIGWAARKPVPEGVREPS